nr:YHYH domain-containing protein [uncultured Ramlibacter sp.]
MNAQKAKDLLQRHPTVEDRAAPGHWEGDLVFGSGNSQIFTRGLETQMRYSICAVLLAIWGSLAFAHGGGLDSSGCHTKKKTGDYHCHRGSGASQGGDNSSAKKADAPTPSAGGPTCYTGSRGGTYTITKSGRKNYAGC